MASVAQDFTRPTTSHMRWVICALLFWVTTANYIDRTVFGNLAPEMPRYLHMADQVAAPSVEQYWNAHQNELLPKLEVQQTSPINIRTCTECQNIARSEIVRKRWDADYWNMQMVFSAAFAVSMLLMGRLMDVLGLRWGFIFACGFWGLASMSHALAPEIGGIFGNPIIGFFICRALLGLGEGGNFPAAIKAVAEWFPKSERALATGLFNSGSNIGGLLAPWGLPFIIAQLSTLTIAGKTVGWRGAFLITGIFDLCWIFGWLAFYRKPAEHPRVSEAELALIECEGREPVTKLAWRELLPHRQTWAITGAKTLTDCFWSFYLFSTPDFFNRKFGLSPDARKYLIMFILVVASVGSIAGGWLAGKFMQRGWTVNKARKVTLLICALVVVPVFYACLTPYKWLAAVLITLAASGHQAWTANVLSLVGDMFPKRVVGSVTGFAGMMSAFGMMALFFVTGKILVVTGNYLPVYILASVAYLLALLLIQLLVPRLEPADVDENKELRKKLRKMAREYATPIS